MSTLTATRPAPATQQTIQKVERFADLPAHIADEWRHLPHSEYAAADAADDECYIDHADRRWSLLTTEGCERESFRLTGVAVIDANNYVARVTVNGGRTAFYPVRNGTHYCSPYGVGGGGLGTKAAAFDWFADNPATPAPTADDIDALNPDLDDRDRAALHEIAASFARIIGPRVGDGVTFPDFPGRRCLFSHDHDERGLQTSDGGSIHLGHYGGSYSGGLDRIRSRDLLSETGETRPQRFWIWHHGRPAAHNGVDVYLPVRVYACTEPFNAPRPTR